MAIIDQHLPGKRLPGCSHTPVGTGHVYGHAMASHTQTNLARQTKETRRVNVSKCIDWVNKGQVMVRETVVETLLFVGQATTAWKLSMVPEQIGSLVACPVIVKAVLKLICRCASYQTCGCLRGNRRGGRARWSSRRRPLREI